MLKIVPHIISIAAHSRYYFWMAIVALPFNGGYAQSRSHRTDFATPVYSVINTLSRGGYTWVGYSSPDYSEALAMQRTYRERGYAGDILAARVDREIYYRIVFGQYSSRQEADTSRDAFKEALPPDSWLLMLMPGMRIMPRSDWLPLYDLVYVEPDSSPPPNSVRVADTLSDTSSSSPEAGQSNASATETSISPNEEQGKDVENGSDEVIEEDIPAPPSSPFLQRHFRAELQFFNSYEDNVNHDVDAAAIRSYGMVPGLHLQFRSSESDPVLTLMYLVARHDYSNTERWDRVSNKFRGVLEPQFSDFFRPETSVELSLKGSSEDRDISNQFEVVQEFEFRITRRHRLQLYGTYRVKRYPDRPGLRDFKPNVGLNFVRTNSDGEQFESGARYEINREQEERGNYRRWTFSVEYRSPEFKDRDQFRIEVKHRNKYYIARFVEIEDEDHLRRDGRLGVRAAWIHRFKGGVSLELDYEYETRGSNDPEKYYKANALSLTLNYVL